jgi:hypothetical protein
MRAAGVTVVAARAAIVLSLLGSGTEPSRGSRHGCGAPDYRVHTAGPSVAGLPLTHTGRSCEPPPVLVVAASSGAPPPATRNDHTSYVYGDCTPGGPRKDPGGCAAPVEIQSAPYCERNYRLYRGIDGGLYPHRLLTIRGVPAASFEGGTIVELYTGHTTISIFGESPALVRRAAARVRVRGSHAAAASQRLARPSPSQRLVCAR